MNSWYVSILLKTRDKIRLSIEDSFSYNQSEFEGNDESIGSSHYGMMYNFDNDDYNNLLLVEKEFENLISSGRISDRDSKIVKEIMEGKSLTQLETILKIDRYTIIKIFERVCDRIAYALGSVFTDEGFLHYIQNKYKLTDAQIETARKFMKSNRRFFYPRKLRNLENND